MQIEDWFCWVQSFFDFLEFFFWERGWGWCIFVLLYISLCLCTIVNLFVNSFQNRTQHWVNFVIQLLFGLFFCLFFSKIDLQHCLLLSILNFDFVIARSFVCVYKFCIFKKYSRAFIAPVLVLFSFNLI